MKPILRFPEFNEKWEYNLFSEVITIEIKYLNTYNTLNLKGEIK